MKTKILLLSAIALLFGNCKPYENSLKREKEVIAIQMTKANPDPNITLESKILLSSLPVGPIISTLLNIGSAALEKESAKYVSDYGCFISANDFYSGSTFNYGGFNLKRSVNINSIPTEAMNINLDFIPSTDHSAFQIKVRDLKLDYSRCKVAKSKKDKVIDIVIKVVIESVWSDDKGPHIMQLGNDEFNLKNVPFLATTTPVDLLGKWIPKIPKSHPGGTGTFVIKVTVVETDEFGDRYASIAKFLNSNKDDLKGIADKLISKD